MRVRTSIGVDTALPNNRARVAALKTEVVDEHRRRIIVHGPTSQKRHHLAHNLVRGDWARNASAVTVFGYRGQRELPRQIHLSLVHPALVMVQCQSVRVQSRPYPRWVASHVHHRTQQGWDTYVGQRSFDVAIAVGERMPGVGIAPNLKHAATLLADTGGRSRDTT